MIADAVRDATIAFYNHNTGKERDKARKQQLMPYIVTMAEAVRAKMGVYCIESNAMQCNAMDRMERLEYLERDRNTVGEFMATIKVVARVTLQESSLQDGARAQRCAQDDRTAERRAARHQVEARHQQVVNGWVTGMPAAHSIHPEMQIFETGPALGMIQSSAARYKQDHVFFFFLSFLLSFFPPPRERGHQTSQNSSAKDDGDDAATRPLAPGLRQSYKRDEEEEEEEEEEEKQRACFFPHLICIATHLQTTKCTPSSPSARLARPVHCPFSSCIFASARV